MDVVCIGIGDLLAPWAGLVAHFSFIEASRSNFALDTTVIHFSIPVYYPDLIERCAHTMLHDQRVEHRTMIFSSLFASVV